MDGKAEEHIVEVAKVLSRYCDLIAMRAFPGFADRTSDEVRDGAQHANRACSGHIHPHIAFIARRRGDRIGGCLLRRIMSAFDPKRTSAVQDLCSNAG